MILIERNLRDASPYNLSYLNFEGRFFLLTDIHTRNTAYILVGNPCTSWHEFVSLLRNTKLESSNNPFKYYLSITTWSEYRLSFLLLRSLPWISLENLMISYMFSNIIILDQFVYSNSCLSHLTLVEIHTLNFYLSQHWLYKHSYLLITSRNPRLSYGAPCSTCVTNRTFFHTKLPYFMINRSASMALLWFPPVGLNHHSNPLERSILQYILLTRLFTPWTILKTFHVATNVSTLDMSLLLPCKYKTRDNLSYAHNTYIGGNPLFLPVEFICWGIHIILELVSEKTTNSFNNLI
jgi:hypothetical protein